MPVERCKPSVQCRPTREGATSIPHRASHTSLAIAAARREDPDLGDNDVVAALTGFDALWASLFPAEQARIAVLLIQRVTVSQAGLMVDLRTEGLGSLVRDMLAPRQQEKAA